MEASSSEEEEEEEDERSTSTPRSTQRAKRTPSTRIASRPLTTHHKCSLTTTHQSTEEGEEGEETEDLSSSDEEEEEEVGGEQGRRKEKYKLRSPFRPPEGMRSNPCWSQDGGSTWRHLEWDARHDLPGGEVWIQPISTFFANERELKGLKEEDRDSGKVKWRQDFKSCYGVHWPIRHLDTFMAAPEVEASVSHRDTRKEGSLLPFFPSQAS